MYVKIIRGIGGDEIETVVDCESMSVSQPKNEDNVVIVFNEQRYVTSFSFELEKATSEVYVMNERGDTVEAYRWPERRQSETAIGVGVPGLIEAGYKGVLQSIESAKTGIASSGSHS